jgi:hypothetical protein
MLKHIVYRMSEINSFFCGHDFFFRGVGACFGSLQRSGGSRGEGIGGPVRALDCVLLLRLRDAGA